MEDIYDMTLKTGICTMTACFVSNTQSEPQHNKSV